MKKKFNITSIIYDKRGKPLSIGKNSYTKTHTYQAKLAKQVGEEHKIYLHSELAAIIKCKDLSKAYKIVVLRYIEDGSPANARPCKICQAAIKAAGIEIVEHT